ncbi:site-specific DNA-methyltransferase, partial [Candidatus Peregrinibacteria bacterium]|nr:site-specific DNA-methyltransferase [Candidatus Peregrinibacteria bacterium]
ENLLIKGNNLIALYSLRQQLAGKVKLIYIDPPYNTGNDGFRYNDNFRHSTWLVFMKNRLEIARELLREDGAILVHCDDNEQAYLKVLMDEIIGRDNYRNMILTRRFDKNLNNQFVESGLKTMNIGADYVLVYAKSPNFQFNPVYRQTTDERASRGYWKGFYNSPNRPTMRYEILGVDINDGQWKWERNKTLEAVYNYEEYLSNHSNISLEEYWINTGKSKKFIRKNPSGASSGKNKGIEHWIAPSDGILRSSNWTDILTTETNSIVSFSNPKSENVMSELIKTITEENDIVLDYHL